MVGIMTTASRIKPFVALKDAAITTGLVIRYTLSGAVTDAFNSRVVNSAINAFNVIKFAAKGALADFKNSSFANAIINGFNLIRFTAKGALADLGNSAFGHRLKDAFNLVRFAAGGLVKDIKGMLPAAFQSLSMSATVALRRITDRWPAIRTAAQAAMQGASTAVSGLRQALAGVRQAFQSVVSAGATIGRVLVPVNLVSAGFRNILAPAARAAASAISSIWSAAMGPLGMLWRAINSIAGAMGFVAGAAGVFVLGRGLTRVAADAEQAQVAFEVMLGSADKAKAMLAEIQDLADNTVLQLPEVRQGARTLLAMSVEAKDVASTLRMLGDVSQGVTVPLSHLARVYGEIKQKGRVMGEDFRQFGQLGVPVVRELATEMGITKQEVYKLGSEGKVTFADLERSL